MHWLARWLVRVFLFLAAVTAATYAADSAVYIFRGSPGSSVKTYKFMGVPLKWKKEEYDFLGAEQTPCAAALFPHNGQYPCWYLRRYPDRWENL